MPLVGHRQSVQCALPRTMCRGVELPVRGVHYAVGCLVWGVRVCACACLCVGIGPVRAVELVPTCVPVGEVPLGFKDVDKSRGGLTMLNLPWKTKKGALETCITCEKFFGIMHL